MQILDSIQTQQLNSASSQVLDTLQNIVSNVQIQPNFYISHPDYKPLKLPAEVVKRFQGIPLNLQSKYLNLQLQRFLYGIYYNGSLRTVLTLDANSTNLSLYQNLENNTLLGVNIEFIQLLHESNAGEGYFSPGWYVLRQESDGRLAVKKDGLTLHIERDRHLQLADRSATVGNLVSIRLPRNLVQNGFYVAVSNVGAVNPGNPDSHSGVVRIYFNFSPPGAVAIMRTITQQLNEIKVPFVFKVLYNPSDYGRYDSGVLYFERNNYEAVRQVIQIIYAENRSHFRMEVPLFTKVLAPGLALAEEPDCKFSAQESFGMNRCQIVALGLLEAWQKGDFSPEGRMGSILKHFLILGINLQRSYLNSNSEDIYRPLDCSYIL
ncbi:MAG TPA: T3SS effector HopA1 family protein [Nostoc sp.]|uniref:T3SS effector HopA1 family protein n=1 Tax=Nostoc sp. TaxID=1180 RepID=UPI002D75991C|nr:T3SS effector HopA1 family protein [Nostoc sp.]HYX14561.1 T3SS effector HopA1 family protein [Nostoc sp.]